MTLPPSAFHTAASLRSPATISTLTGQTEGSNPLKGMTANPFLSLVVLTAANNFVPRFHFRLKGRSKPITDGSPCQSTIAFHSVAVPSLSLTTNESPGDNLVTPWEIRIRLHSPSASSSANRPLTADSSSIYADSCAPCSGKPDSSHI